MPAGSLQAYVLDISQARGLDEGTGAEVLARADGWLPTPDTYAPGRGGTAGESQSGQDRVRRQGAFVGRG